MHFKKVPTLKNYIVKSKIKSKTFKLRKNKSLPNKNLGSVQANVFHFCIEPQGIELLIAK